MGLIEKGDSCQPMLLRQRKRRQPSRNNGRILLHHNKPFSFYHLSSPLVLMMLLLLTMMLPCLLLHNLSNLASNGSGGLSFSVLPAAQAFVLTDPTTTSKHATSPFSLPPSNQYHHHCHHPRRRRRRRQTQTPKSRPVFLSSVVSTTALHFFFGTPSSETAPNKDLPLARYVDLSANYTLAHTPEDYIDLQENQRLVCIGDVHGDLKALVEFLETAGVYDRSTDSWCGGNTILVQCGDVLDRGLEELACYRLLSKLSQEALLWDGRVILLVGNHEALNAMGLFQYAMTDHEHEQRIGKAVDEILGPQNQWRKQYANNQPARWASYEPGGLLAHSLLRNMKVAVRVGKTVCVHAGLLPQHLKDHGGIAGMNEAFRDWISLGDDVGIEQQEEQPQPPSQQKYYKPPIQNPVVYNHHGNYATPRQPWIDAEQRQQYYINSIPPFLQSKPGDPGPIWMRDYSTPHDAPLDPADTFRLEQELDTTLTLLDADRMVMGHTIQQKINGILGGKAWRLDVGASRGCLHGTPEVLEVVCRRQKRRMEDTSTATTAEEHEQDSSILTESVFVLVPSSSSTTPAGSRIPAKERLVDAYTQAAVELL